MGVGSFIMACIHFLWPIIVASDHSLLLHFSTDNSGDEKAHILRLMG
jgi:hypothetical protein